MFLFGMTMMSEGLQKSAGDKLRSFMASMTSNAFKRVITGTTITALIQSSSATTIMVVSFVNAGLLTLGNAIGVIMGANIGTTLTAWITSLGFSVDIALFAVPMMGIGFVLMSCKKNTIKNIGQFLIGFAIMYVGLTFMKDFSNAILGEYQPQMLTFFGLINHYGFGSVLLFLMAGAILTIVLQASSATMAITMLLASTGLIDYQLAVAMVLGENIGTTITANIAASVANTSAKRAAMAHTIFNLIGVCWVLALFKPIIKLISFIMTGCGAPDPLTIDMVGANAAVEAAQNALTAANLSGVGVAEAQASLDAAIDVFTGQKNTMLYGIAVLHTLFNVTNTFILIWFTPIIEKLATLIVKAKPGEEEEVFRLKYIHGGPIMTAEMSLNEAQHEIIHFAEICYNGFKYVRQAINEENKENFDKLNKKLIKYEEITDKIEFEIASYLNEVSNGDISEESSNRIKEMYKIIGEMESLGDSGEAIGRILTRKNIHEKNFDDTMKKRLNQLLDLVDNAYNVMIENLKNPMLTDIANAVDAEYNINTFRNDIREEHMMNLENGQYNYLTGVYYIDIVSQLEQIGDFIINISEACVRSVED